MSSIILTSVVSTWNGSKTVSAVTFAPIRLAKAMPCSTAFPASSDPSVGMRMLVYIDASWLFEGFAGSIQRIFDFERRRPPPQPGLFT